MYRSTRSLNSLIFASSHMAHFSCPPEVSAMPRRRSITSQVIGRCIRGGVSCAHGTAASRGRRALAGVAFASPPESARSRSRGRHIDPASLVSRDWAGTTEPRYAVASRRAARRAPARAQRIAGSGGLRAGLPRALTRGPGTRPARTAIDLVLAGHEPFPAIAVDRHWRLVAANEAVELLLRGVDQDLLQQPVNVLRVALHPNGLAPRTVNLVEWRAHLLARLRHQIELTADPELIKLLNELQRYPVAWSAKPPPAPPGAAIVLPFQLQTEHGIVTLISTVTVFGTPIDVTVAELALECFYPADTATADILQRAAAIRRDFRARSGTVSHADGRRSDMQ